MEFQDGRAMPPLSTGLTEVSNESGKLGKEPWLTLLKLAGLSHVAGGQLPVVWSPQPSFSFLNLWQANPGLFYGL